STFFCCESSGSEETNSTSNSVACWTFLRFPGMRRFYDKRPHNPSFRTEQVEDPPSQRKRSLLIHWHSLPEIVNSKSRHFNHLCILLSKPPGCHSSGYFDEEFSSCAVQGACLG